MAETPRRPVVYTIPPTRPFADSLAAGLLDSAGGDPAGLTSTLVLLPTRRACRTVREAFLRQSGGEALLLPRLQPLGDVDEEDLVLRGGEEPLLTGALDAPPAISEVRRRLLLAELILKKAAAAGETMRADQASWLAAELARLLDQVQTERLDFARLPDLVREENLARHWQQTVEFLKIVTAEWPAILAEEGAVDPAERRNRLLEAQAAAWRANPPAHPVIAAGSTGSIPATAELLGVVASLPLGAVILPGMDTGFLDDEDWGTLPPSHPQFGMARLLDRLGIGRAEVGEWPGEPRETPPVPRVPAARAALVSEAMRPAESLAREWPGRLDTNAAFDAMRGVTYLRAPGVREEAGAIALLLREALERDDQPNERPRTAALVTPDRDLARRVAAELGRWGLEIDDSAGVPLGATAPGAFLRLSAQAIAEQLAPVPLAALLKHPLTALGGPPSGLREAARVTERYLLRGPRPGPGLDGLRHRLAAMRKPDDHRAAISANDAKTIGDLLERLEAAVAPLADAMSGPARRVPDLLAAHLTTAEALAASDEAVGAARLWAREAGESAAAFVESLMEGAHAFPAIEPAQYPAFLEAMMDGHVVRPRYGAHPRLAILGPLEARLVQPDWLILGGLNEGTWPRETPTDPWMSRPMRQDFGLPELERRIGLAAHDFQQAFCAPRVFLTRAAKAEGTPTVPSRWLLRLETVLKGVGLLAEGGGEVTWPETETLSLLLALNRPPERNPIDRPAPAPPAEIRPRRLSVTEIERWMRDPYEIYAKRILRLSALDPLDADPGAAERGQFIHNALEAFIRENPAAGGEGALGRLLELGGEAFGDALSQPTVLAFWWPRFEAIARWFLDHEAERDGVAERVPEQRGAIPLSAPGEDIILSARADRLDRLADGALAVIDYKTGGVPQPKEIKAGLAPQLPLEAVIAEDGGFARFGKAAVSELLYWQLKGVRDPAQEIAVKAIETRIAEAREGLARLIAAFYEDGMPYAAVPRERYAPGYSDYELLERVGEWRPERRRP